jgi:hypothetical protein
MKHLIVVKLQLKNMCVFLTNLKSINDKSNLEKYVEMGIISIKIIS